MFVGAQVLLPIIFLSTFKKCHNLRNNNNKSQKAKIITKCYGSTEESTKFW